MEPDAIARELGATMLVDGRDTAIGRSAAHHAEPDAAGHRRSVRWQNAYDGTFAEMFTLQREVADAVAGALRLEVAPAGGMTDARPTEKHRGVRGLFPGPVVPRAARRQGQPRSQHHAVPERDPSRPTIRARSRRP